jgi:hypothetical protein
MRDACCEHALTLVQPRLEGKVEIRPGVGVTAPVHVSMVTIHLQRREMINPTADSIIRSQVSSQRREITDMVGRQMCLYKVPPGRDAEHVLLMDLPFMVFIPFGRGGEEVARRVPPASLQLDKRTAETFYELVVELRNGSEIRKYAFPVPIARYDTLSTFGMYNRPESAERTTDHIVTLGISLPRWSYGPLDPVSVYIKLSPNADWMSKAKRVTIHLQSRRRRALTQDKGSCETQPDSWRPNAGSWLLHQPGLGISRTRTEGQRWNFTAREERVPNIRCLWIYNDRNAVQDRVLSHSEGV